MGSEQPQEAPSEQALPFLHSRSHTEQRPHQSVGGDRYLPPIISVTPLSHAKQNTL